MTDIIIYPRPYHLCFAKASASVILDSWDYFESKKVIQVGVSSHYFNGRCAQEKGIPAGSHSMERQ